MPDATELPLWMQPQAPSTPPDTSVAAANAIQPHLNRLEREVLETIRRHGGLTALELEAITGMKGSTIRPRLWALCGNASAGQPKPRALIWMSEERRNGARVYRVIQ